MTNGPKAHPPLISYHQAKAILQSVEPIAIEQACPLDKALGRVLTATVKAPLPSPQFTNSAMDGFALKAADASSGAAMAIVGEIFAGITPDASVPNYQPGGACRVMTGARVPDWADTVVPVERTLVADGKVSFDGAVLADQNIRLQGEDIAVGDVLLPAGTRLDPHRLLLLANFGFAEVRVKPQPELLLLATGDELVDLGQPLPPGAIYNSSQELLKAEARQLGLPILSAQKVADDEALFQQTIAQTIDFERPQLIVTTGAVSAGEKDFIPSVGREMGFEALFHKVAIRPGKPVYFARKGQVYWLGLPGNPISTAVGWQIFVRPLLEAWAGIPGPRKFSVTLANEVRKPQHLRAFFRAQISSDHQAEVHSRQGSAHFQASLAANGLVELPEGTAVVPAGTHVEAVLI